MTQRRTGARVSVWVTVALSAAAAVAVGFGVFSALGREDTEPVESPLALPVARQLERGPWELYGPFGGRNPLVLIHAPLYYRVAALVAWPLCRAGVEPVWAALAAGRSLSFLGLAATLAAAYRLARLDGAPRGAGCWAALLIASSPVVSVMPYTVRPDMPGIALQTTGVLLVLTVLRSERPRRTTLPAAFAAFGLAACIKQHFIVEAVISTLLLLTAWLRGRLALNLITRGLLTGLAIVLIVYGTEELATGGRMSQAVFQAAAGASRVHPASWMRLWIVFYAIMGKSTGLIALLVAAGLAGIGAKRGIGRRALAAAGIAVLGSIAALSSLDFVGAKMAEWEMVLSVVNVLAPVFLVIPAFYFVPPAALSAGQLDRALWIYAAAELALVLALSRASTGAWVNYGIQAFVFGSVLTARALVRACAGCASRQASLLIALAALVILIGVIANAKMALGSRLVQSSALRRVFEHYKRPSSQFFFAGCAGDNRLYGQQELVYDDWLYPVFESIHLAEPRSVWLRHALTSDPIRFIVNTSGSPTIDGLGESLLDLGYRPGIQVGPLFVWERSASGSVRRRR